MLTGFLGLVQLFGIFFYVGLFAVGGGLVAATFMQQVLVEKYAVISAEQFYSMLAISESTPGPIGVNLATYCGVELFGPVGGIVTTFGELLPSLIIIMLISRFFSNFQKKPLVQAAFNGLRPATAGMVLVATINVFVIALLNTAAYQATGNLLNLFQWKQIVFYIIALVLLFLVKKMHPVFVVLAGALFGVIFL
ncbi:MAG: chromate transporter [Treponema sp.]|nr:chromate transporter [Treponema sp.]MBR6193366.1 chromate transporter [Treponema sp.]